MTFRPIKLTRTWDHEPGQDCDSLPVGTKLLVDVFNGNMAEWPAPAEIDNDGVRLTLSDRYLELDLEQYRFDVVELGVVTVYDTPWPEIDPDVARDMEIDAQMDDDARG